MADEAKPQAIEVRYHVFTHGTDAWFAEHEWRKARRLYGAFARATGSARLYEEVYSDLEMDEMESEDCLCSFGEYPW